MKVMPHAWIEALNDFVVIDRMENRPIFYQRQSP
jgi:hypothetical protein